MNRFLFMLAILICVTTPSFAQKKVEKYCMFTTTLLSSKGNGIMRITLGKCDVDSLFSFKDSSVQANLSNIAASLKTESDLLNYMASQGWSLVTYAGMNYQFPYGRFIFKREFDPSELKSSQ